MCICLKHIHASLAVFICTDNTFGLGTGPVLIEYIYCNGNELSVWGCTTLNNNYMYNDRNSAGLRCENYPINKGNSKQIEAIQRCNTPMHTSNTEPKHIKCRVEQFAYKMSS